MQQLRNTYGVDVSYSLFLCGYFDSGYLGYEAAEGIDWIWEHRINDYGKRFENCRNEGDLHANVPCRLLPVSYTHLVSFHFPAGGNFDLIPFPAFPATGTEEVPFDRIVRALS